VLRVVLFLISAVLFAQDPRPYVVLVSLDGFRADYPERFQATNLLAVAREGVRADALIPSYRTNTFPNHYSIATGLYPAHHGIVDNNFFDKQRREFYTTGTGDGSWYGGTPLWVLAEKQGIRAAAFFWPATDLEIQGTRPSFYFKYDGTVPNTRRVEQVLTWLRLPEAERPHLITLYFSVTDDTGHEYGPESSENAKGVAEVDALIGTLRRGLAETGLPVNLFVVSDHGMLATRPIVKIGSTTDFPGFEISPRTGSQIMLYSTDADQVDETYARLKRQESQGVFRVFRRNETPAHLHYRDNLYRIGDLVLMATTPSYIGIEEPGRRLTNDPGAHGWDPRRYPEMRGIFFAQGPALRSGLRLKPFENVNIYPLIAKILGLKPPTNLDGKLAVLQRALK
jgi:alkaline phosphatase D